MELVETEMGGEELLRKKVDGQTTVALFFSYGLMQECRGLNGCGIRVLVNTI